MVTFFAKVRDTANLLSISYGFHQILLYQFGISLTLSRTLNDSFTWELFGRVNLFHKVIDSASLEIKG